MGLPSWFLHKDIDMADLAVVPASVVGSGIIQVGQGVAGATISAGDSLYLDATGVLKPSSSTSSVLTAAAVGIAQHGSLTNQPIRYQTAGLINLGVALTPGLLYGVSANNGKIAPITDVVS